MSAPSSASLVASPMPLLAVLLAVLAALFALDRHPRTRGVFRVIPLLVFAYFVPTLLSNQGVIPLSSPLYGWIKSWLLPASLILLTLSVDIPAILRLGKPALVLFLSATAGILVGGPLAYLALGWMVPAELGDQTWRGLAALSGSWIGGGANFVAIGETFEASQSTIGLMVVVDVAVASVWMAVLLWFAGRSRRMDQAIGADSTTIDTLQHKVETFHAEVARPTNLADLLAIALIGLGGAVLAHEVGSRLPPIGDFIAGFAWIVILATTIGVALSFTPLRKLEGAGAGALGSVFLYLLVASIGAQAEFRKVLDAPALVAIGAVWMMIHAAIILVVRRLLRAPIFFAAVGSQANVGGAASAPIVAAAFHPSLASVGVLLAVGGYVLGTYVALICGYLLRAVHGVWF